jgi:Do/DeqQ family serine protease
MIKVQCPMKLNRLSIALFALLAACSDPQARSTAQTVPPALETALPDVQLAEPTRHVPGDVGAIKTSFAPVVKKASPAVVNIFSRRLVRQRVDPFWDFFNDGGVPRERVEQSLGSGVLVRSDGIVVTNNHVIDGMQEIMVVLADRREFPAKVLLADPKSDLAVLRMNTNGERLPVLAIDEREPVLIGDLVLAIGNPFGVGQTVTNGIVSALARTDVGITDYSFFIQTDAAINPGNSGGALVDMDGDLIGLNTAIFSRSGSSSGIGFAIPATMVKQVVESALGGRSSVVRPWLGIKTQAVTSEIARSLGLDRPEGVLIADIFPGGPAERAGVKQGDLILAIDGQAVNDEAAINYRIGTRKPGETAVLQVRREGTMRTVTAKVAPPPSEPARDERVLTGRHPMDGASVVNLSPAVADEFGADPFVAREGVLVIKVSAQTYAVRAGFQRGDLIREVNGRQIRSTRDLAEALKSGASVWRITIQRGPQTITAQFRL